MCQPASHGLVVCGRQAPEQPQAGRSPPAGVGFGTTSPENPTGATLEGRRRLDSQGSHKRSYASSTLRRDNLIATVARNGSKDKWRWGKRAECAPTNPAHAPIYPTCVPTNTTSFPLYPACVPINTTSMPINISCVLFNPTCIPTNTTSIPHNTTSMPINISWILFKPYPPTHSAVYRRTRCP
jgi:hypothetical protein